MSMKSLFICCSPKVTRSTNINSKKLPKLPRNNSNKHGDEDLDEYTTTEVKINKFVEKENCKLIENHLSKQYDVNEFNKEDISKSFDGSSEFGSPVIEEYRLKLTNIEGTILEKDVILNRYGEVLDKKQSNDEEENQDLNVIFEQKDGENQHLFIIYYNSVLSKFYIKTIPSMSKDSIPKIFIKINKFHILRKKETLLVEFFLFFISRKENKIIINYIDTRKDHNEEIKKFEFEYLNKPIKIGRSNECDICIPVGKEISRIHFNLRIDNRKLLLFDGFEHPSTNGVWINVKNSFEIYNGALIRNKNGIIRANFYIAETNV